MVGILPLIHLRHFVFGNSLISIPFFDLGGVLADDKRTAQLLLKEALGVAQKIGASEIELRHAKPAPEDQEQAPAANSGTPWSSTTRTHKHRFLLELPGSAAELMDSFKAKLRSQIKKAIKDGLKSKIGGAELLDEFYRVFSVNMRDLGSPVHSKKLMSNVLTSFDGQVRIILVQKDGRTLRVAWSWGFERLWRIRGLPLSLNSAASIRTCFYIGPCSNMPATGGIVFLISVGLPSERGHTGLKRNRGAIPVPLHWQYWQQNADSERQESPEAAQYSRAMRCWQRLPVPLTRWIGPPIERHIGL